MFKEDHISAKDGSEITLTFYAHASVGVKWNGVQIYVDPVGEKYGIDFRKEAKADIILLTHHHSDHLDSREITSLSKESTCILGARKCSELVGCTQLSPYQSYQVDSVGIQTIPAYNITESHLHFHPKKNGGLGYVLNLGGKTIYFAGDTEDNEDVLSLRDIDIMFLPVNQPYTMTLRQVENVAKTVHPQILYPYHCGTSYGTVTDVSSLKESLKDICEVRIRNMI